MLTPMEDFLALEPVLCVLLAAFVASQSWIGIVLGDTGEKLLRLQLVCLSNWDLTPEATGREARRMLEQEWTERDVLNFHKHFILDFWIHPVIYGLFFTSALFHVLKKSKKKKNQSNDDMNMNCYWYGRMAAAFIVVAALCDVLENMRHCSMDFRVHVDPSQQAHQQQFITVDASDRLLWEASVLASAKWAIMTVLGSWLSWQYLVSSTSQTVSVSETTRQSPKRQMDPTWVGPRTGDFLNAPLEEFGLLDVQGRKIPWTVTIPDYYHCDPERSYTVSPYSHYITYGLDEVKLHLAKKPWIVHFLVEVIIKYFGYLLQLLQLDECLYVNNWLLSTNLWPSTIQWSSEQVQAINDELLHNVLKEQKRNKAIVWRSVDALSQPEMTKVLQESSCSCLLVPSRIVNWLDYGDERVKRSVHKKANYKRDISLFRKLVGWDIEKQTKAHGWETSKYEMATIAPHDLTLEMAEQVVDLYNQLYLKKYSRINPQVTPAGMIRMVQSGFATLQVLRIRTSTGTSNNSNNNKRGRIVGFGTETTVDGVAINSYVGYDLANDADRDLYRLTMTMLTFGSYARCGATKFHQSGGANEFKRHRGAATTVEYNAVFLDHLPAYSPIRLGWRLVKALSDRVLTVERAR